MWARGACGRKKLRPYNVCAYPSTQGPGFAIILLFTCAPRAARLATKKPGGGPGFIYEGVVFTF
jgi:hypothetical protein